MAVIAPGPRKPREAGHGIWPHHRELRDLEDLQAEILASTEDPLSRRRRPRSYRALNLEPLRSNVRVTMWPQTEPVIAGTSARFAHRHVIRQRIALSWIVSIVCGLASGFVTADLINFAQNDSYLIHPIPSAFAGVAAAWLGVVAALNIRSLRAQDERIGV